SLRASGYTTARPPAPVSTAWGLGAQPPSQKVSSAWGFGGAAPIAKGIQRLGVWGRSPHDKRVGGRVKKCLNGPAHEERFMMAIEQSADPMQAFYQQLESKSMDALWRRPQAGERPVEPVAPYQPARWRSADIL